MTATTPEATAMCPFCVGAAAWAVAGAVSAGGLGMLAAVVQRDRKRGDVQAAAPVEVHERDRVVRSDERIPDRID
jgi:hypothetical protein